MCVCLPALVKNREDLLVHNQFGVSSGGKKKKEQSDVATGRS